MTVSPNHRLVWAGLDKVAWDNVGSQSARVPHTQAQRSCWGYKSPARHSSPALCVLWARHSPWSAPLVSGTDLLFDLDGAQVPVAESGREMDPADRLADRELHKRLVAAILPLSSLS